MKRLCGNLRTIVRRCIPSALRIEIWFVITFVVAIDYAAVATVWWLFFK